MSGNFCKEKHVVILFSIHTLVLHFIAIASEDYLLYIVSIPLQKENYGNQLKSCSELYFHVHKDKLGPINIVMSAKKAFKNMNCFFKCIVFCN